MEGSGARKNTGITELDVKTGGFQDGEVTIITARPSMGKTDVMLHIAKTAGWNQYLPIVFSLEMPEKMVTNHLIASTGGFNRSSMRNLKAFLNQSQKEMWSLCIGNLDGFRKIGIFSLKMNKNYFVFIFAKNQQEAIQFFTDSFFHRPLNCHEYPLWYELNRGNEEISFMEMRKEHKSFPAIAGYFQGY